MKEFKQIEKNVFAFSTLRKTSLEKTNIDTKIILLRSEILGVSAARNKGAHFARSTWIAFLEF